LPGPPPEEEELLAPYLAHNRSMIRPKRSKPV
jgi:hypothetical protein